MNESKEITKDELKIINRSIKKLRELEMKEKKIQKAQKKEIETIQNVWKRYCDDKDLQEKVARNKEACDLLERAKTLISELRSFFR